MPAYLDRGSQRDTMLLIATMRVREGAEAALRVRNLSSGGLMAETPIAIAEGSEVIVTLRGIGEVTARVIWCGAGRIGLAFAAPVDPRRARVAKPRSAGTEIGLVKPVGQQSRRPALRRG